MYVYILRSVHDPKKSYIGLSRDPWLRLKYHNAADNLGWTSRFQPWQIHWYACFNSTVKASEFEKYLKQGSGKAFLRKHLW